MGGSGSANTAFPLDHELLKEKRKDRDSKLEFFPHEWLFFSTSDQATKRPLWRARQGDKFHQTTSTQSCKRISFLDPFGCVGPTAGATKNLEKKEGTPRPTSHHADHVGGLGVKHVGYYVTYRNARDLNVHEHMSKCLYVRMLGSMFTPLYVHVTHTTHTYTHTRIHTHTHAHTPHCNMFVHTPLLQPNLSQRWAETSEFLGRISSSELDLQSCVVLLCWVLFCSSEYVHMYISVYSFALFSFALLAEGRFF